MPLTPLPPSNTARYKLYYTFAGVQHVVQVRAIGAHSPASFGTFMDGIFTSLNTALWALSVIKVEFAAVGSDVFNLVTTGIEGNAYGSGTPVGLLVPQFIAFQGRSSGGRKVRMSIYGIKPEENDYRFEPGDSAAVDAAISALAASSNFGASIDGLDPTWYLYANTGFNAYWQRKQREV